MANIYLKMGAGRSHVGFSTYAGFILTAPDDTVYYIFMGNSGTPAVNTSDSNTGSIRWNSGSLGVEIVASTDLESLGINQNGVWTISTVRFLSDNGGNTATLYSSSWSYDDDTYTSLGTSGTTTTGSYQTITVGEKIILPKPTITGSSGTRAIATRYPVEEGLTARTQKQTGMVMNLVAQNSIVPERKTTGVR